MNVYLYKDKKRKTYCVHRLVIEAFIRRMKKGEVCDHINTIRHDNRLENLRICSTEENNRNPITAKKRRRPVFLIEVDYPHREFTFCSTFEASKFFGYKRVTTFGGRLSKARKKGSKIATIQGQKFYYSQAFKCPLYSR